LLDRQPHLIQAVERDPQRPNRALQHRRERDVERVAAFFQQAARVARLLAPLVGQVDVGPAREPVLLVPGAFTVPKQNECMHGTVGPSRLGPYTRSPKRTRVFPAKTALFPSSSSIRRSWLYLQMRSVRLAEPVLICPAPVATARSAIVESSVSSDRCEM